MNGFLLVMRMELCDLPVQFFSTLDDAKLFVSENVDDGKLSKSLVAKMRLIADSVDFNMSDSLRCDVMAICNGSPNGLVYSEVFE